MSNLQVHHTFFSFFVVFIVFMIMCFIVNNNMYVFVLDEVRLEQPRILLTPFSRGRRASFLRSCELGVRVCISVWCISTPPTGAINCLPGQGKRLFTKGGVEQHEGVWVERRNGLAGSHKKARNGAWFKAHEDSPRSPSIAP